MSTEMVKLEDRIVTDTGEVILGYECLLNLARDGRDFHSHRAIKDERVEQYNRIAEKILDQWNDDGEAVGPSDESYEWNTPEDYKTIDVYELCDFLLEEKKLRKPKYLHRLKVELNEMERVGMFPVVRHLCFLVDDFIERDVVWGVGRGSSCASLVLFLIGLNKVDPVEYDIPAWEFLKGLKEENDQNDR